MLEQVFIKFKYVMGESNGDCMLQFAYFQHKKFQLAGFIAVIVQQAQKTLYGILETGQKIPTWISCSEKRASKGKGGKSPVGNRTGC